MLSLFLKCFNFIYYKKYVLGTSLAVQWLQLHTSNAQGIGLIPGQGTKTPHATQCGQKMNNNNDVIKPAKMTKINK